MTIHYQKTNNLIVVLGQTFEHRELIRALGGRFNRLGRVWNLPYSETNLAQVDTLCRQYGGGPLGGTLLRESQPEVSRETFPEATLDRDVYLSYTIQELVSRVHLAISQQFPSMIWVVGEIQNLAKRDSGIFLTLNERKNSGSESASISVKTTLWWSNYQYLVLRYGREKIEELLSNDLQVRFLCKVDFYRDRAQVSLSVMDIDFNYTKGALALAREELLKELRSKGLDRTNKLLEMPVFPFRVGLITAAESRAYSDFCDQLRSYAFPGEVIFVSATMQGEGVYDSVQKALRSLLREEPDLVVITRGGGSAADLRWFDHRKLAFAMAKYPIPIIAAIGHHDDRCVIEEICFERQKTPTAAADFIAHCFQAANERITSASHRLANLCSRYLDFLSKGQTHLEHRFARSIDQWLVRLQNQLSERTTQLSQRFFKNCLAFDRLLSSKATALWSAARDSLARSLERLVSLEHDLVSKDPKPWLQRGWTQLWSDKGPIKKVSQCYEGMLVKSRLIDGLLKLKVEETILNRKLAKEDEPWPK